MATDPDPNRLYATPQEPDFYAKEREVDLERLVFDPEYRARMRDALNRTADAHRSDSEGVP